MKTMRGATNTSGQVRYITKFTVQQNAAAFRLMPILLSSIIIISDDWPVRLGCALSAVRVNSVDTMRGQSALYASHEDTRKRISDSGSSQKLEN